MPVQTSCLMTGQTGAIEIPGRKPLQKHHRHDATGDKSDDRGVTFEVADVGTETERERDRNILSLL